MCFPWLQVPDLEALVIALQAEVRKERQEKEEVKEEKNRMKEEKDMVNCQDFSSHSETFCCAFGHVLRSFRV